jgi:hypothetical protein
MSCSLSDCADAGSVNQAGSNSDAWTQLFHCFLHMSAIARCGAARGNQHIFQVCSPAVGIPQGRRSNSRTIGIARWRLAN